MSLLVGKRNHLDVFGDEHASPDQSQSIKAKGFKYNSTQTRDSLAKTLLQKKLDILKSQFEGFEEKVLIIFRIKLILTFQELLSALEDCDNDLEIAKQVLSAIKRDRYLEFEEEKKCESPNDENKNPNSSQLKQPSEIEPNKQNFQKSDMMDETAERRAQAQKIEQVNFCKELTHYLITGIKTAPSTDTAVEFMYTSLKHIISIAFKSEWKSYEIA